MKMPEETCRELADCLERLRRTIGAVRAGGISGWSRAPKEQLGGLDLHEAAKAVTEPEGPGVGAPKASPPPPAPPTRRGETPVEAHMVGSRQVETGFAATEGDMPSRDRVSAEAETGDLLTGISGSLSGCSRCRLHAGRTNLVFGEGSTRSGIVFVGEGPGFDEDKQGRPFVGRAGRLLDKMIQAMGFNRPEVYICNVVKCRPPENRTPQPDEIEKCLPFLIKQIETLKPKVVCTLGACASQSLLGTAKPISQLRGKIHIWRGIPLICTYHPAYLLRNPIQKAAAWQDLKEVLDILRPER